MNTRTAFKATISTFAVATGIGIFAAPTASAIQTTTEQFTNCRITDDTYIQQLAEDLTLDEGYLVELINDYRAENGLDPIEVSSELAPAAVIATHDSALRGFSPSDHVDSLGRDLWGRFDACGVTDYNYAAEINYYGTGVEVSESATSAFAWWQSSPSHNAVMLDPDLTHMGLALGYNGEIGQVQQSNSVHWTVVFTD